MSWNYNDLTSAAGGAPPAATGALTAYTLGYTQHVLYRGSADNHIHELWWDSVKGVGSWHTNDLTRAAAGAPDIVPGRHLIGFGDGSTQHVFFVDYPKGDLHELRWDRSAGWSDNNLSVTAGVPAPLPTTQFAAWVDDTGDKVVYQGTDHAIYQLDGGGAVPWSHVRLPWTVVVTAGTALTGYSGPTPGTESIGYVDGNGLVHQLLITSGGSTDYPLSTDKAAASTGLVSYNQTKLVIPRLPPHNPIVKHIPRLQYVDASNLIRSLSANPSWTNADLTSSAKAEQAAPGESTLIGWFSPISELLEVFYIPPSGRVSTIEWGDDADGPWVFYGIVTGAYSAPGAAGPLAGYYWAEQNTEHVFFVGSQDQSVYEVWRSTP